jgi:hypothetical protein
MTHKNRKYLAILCFEVLDVPNGGLKAYPVTWIPRDTGTVSKLLFFIKKNIELLLQL